MSYAILKILSREENMIHIIGQSILEFHGTQILYINYMTEYKDYETTIHLN